MRKVLIISYFFPPCNFVGAERTGFWADNLYKEDIYPIVLTRNWNYNQKDIIGRVHNNKYKLDKNINREIHYLKHKFQVRDLLTNFNLIRKTMTLSRQILFYLVPKSIPYYNIYLKARELLSVNKDIKTVIVSGKPFESFFFGYQLKKEFPQIHWIPDYRDQWNTYSDEKSKNKLTKVFNYLEKKLEKKWTSNCKFFISTTPIWVKNIEHFINKKGFFIANGYDKKIDLIEPSKNTDFVKIIYAGTLYPNQKIEKFCKIISDQNKIFNNFFKIEFIGCEMIESQIKRLEIIKRKHSGEITITPKMSKQKLAEKMNQADFLYLTSFNNVSGWYPVKLFDYATYNTPILMYPSDGDLMEKFIVDTNTGFAIIKTKDLKSLLISTLNKKRNNENLSVVKNLVKLKEFSREYQTAKLANLLINQ